MKVKFNLNKFWYGVGQYKDEFEKKIHDNTTKENVTVMSSIILIKYSPKRRNDNDFKDFEKLTYFSNHEDDIQSYQILAWSRIVSV